MPRSNPSSIWWTNDSKALAYGFTFDSFSNMLTATVGSKNLTANTYGYRNGGLSKQTYSNGDMANYFYDKLGRIRTVFCADRRILRYVYHGEGQPNSLNEISRICTPMILLTNLCPVRDSQPIPTNHTITQKTARSDVKAKLRAVFLPLDF